MPASDKVTSTIRHAFISTALVNGTPEAMVRQWVGHVDRDIIKLYTHIADSSSQEAMARLGNAARAPETAPPTDRHSCQDVELAQIQHSREELENEQSTS